jgi:hypothetical protein
MLLELRERRLNKSTIFPALSFAPMRYGLRGYFQRTTSAVFGMSLCHLAASFADWFISGGRSDYSSSVKNRMTVLAKCYSIGNIIAKIGTVFPCLDVVSVYHANCPAFLASEIISFVNSGSPLLIPITAAPLVIRFTRRICSTFRRTVSSIDVSWSKHVSAKMAGYDSGGMSDLITSTRTVKMSKSRVPNKNLSANPACFSPAFIAIKPIWLTGNKFLLALFADKMICLFILFINTWIAKTTFMVNWFSAFSACFHIGIVPQLERISTAFPDLEIKRLE